MLIAKNDQMKCIDRSVCLLCKNEKKLEVLASEKGDTFFSIWKQNQCQVEITECQKCFKLHFVLN